VLLPLYISLLPHYSEDFKIVLV